MISSSKKEFLIEYRPSSIRAARVSSLRPPLVIEEVLTIAVKEGESTADKVRAFAGVKANGYLVGSCVVYPKHRLVRRVALEAPKGKETDFIFDILKNELKSDAANSIAYCLSPETGDEVSPTESNKKNVMVCGALKSEIVELQESLLEDGIYPTRLEIGTIGLIGAIQKVLKSQNLGQPVLILEIENEFSNAIILGAGGVEMSRRIDSGYDDIAISLKEEMSLKDKEAAERLLRSTAFDFGSIGHKILRRVLRELQSSIGFFEVQTGQSISKVLCVRHHESAGWLQNSISQLLNLEALKVDLVNWLGEHQVTVANDETGRAIDDTWLSLMSLVSGIEKGKN